MLNQVQHDEGMKLRAGRTTPALVIPAQTGTLDSLVPGHMPSIGFK